jgi:hypothetical protein
MAIVNAQLKTTQLDVLTVPAGKSYAITNILVCNTDNSADASFDMHFIPDGDPLNNKVTRVINNLTLPAAETFTFDSERIVLEEGDRVSFVAGPEDIPTALNAPQLEAGAQYLIVTTGDTDFTLIGAADSNPGTSFIATGPGTGTGTARLDNTTDLAVTISYLEV